MPTPIATWSRARGAWETAGLNLLCGHLVPFLETWPASGMTLGGRLYPLPAPGHRTSGNGFSSSPGLLPTPTCPAPHDSADGAGKARKRRPGYGLELPNAVIDLLPTPSAGSFNDGENLESWQARQARQAARGINGNGMGTPLPIAVQLLPTPLVTNRAGMEPSPATLAGKRGHDLGPSIGALLKTPTAQLAVNGGSQHPDKRRDGGHGPTLADQVEHELLPTLRATDGTKGGPNQRGSSGDLMLPSAVMGLLPTPMAADGERMSLRMPRGNPTLIGALLPTPAANDSANTPENHLRKKPGRSQVTSLQVIVDYGLLPSGGRISPPSADGKPSSDDQLQGQLSLGEQESA